VLNNLRNKFDPILEKIGIGFAKLGFGPSFWTWIGLFLSIISAIMFSLHSPSIGASWYTATFLGGLFLIIAGFFDAVDGAVARVTKKTSALGNFLDSVIDKVSEIVVFIGILIGNFTNPVLVLVTLSLSILVSYTRAKGDSIGVDLKGKGIAERAERILILAILAFIPFKDNISVALWIISILAIITILERLKIISEVFGMPLFSIQTFSQIFKREDMSNQSFSSFSNYNRDQSTTKSPSNNKGFLNKQDNKKDLKSDESKSTNSAPKASYLDSTDPNETGRNTAQIIFEQEKEDKKTLGKSTTSSSPSSADASSTTTTTTSNNKKENKESTTSSSPSSADASSTTTTTTSNNKKENNETKI
jgi:phosphatidylglycerophosphate synthase